MPLAFWINVAQSSAPLAVFASLQTISLFNPSANACIDVITGKVTRLLWVEIRCSSPTSSLSVDGMSCLSRLVSMECTSFCPQPNRFFIHESNPSVRDPVCA